MRLMLAPMEGVVDYTMRALLTSVGGYDRCVTEFIRITSQTLPAKVFYRFCPELKHGAATECGTPVYIQLLGSDPKYMASNASTAVELGAPGIDLNFGCPSKTVNNHGGGSALLREPKLVAAVVGSVFRAVGNTVPVTAKMRLGYDDALLFEEIAQRVVDAGASELCIHARTRKNGYRPPAFWEKVAVVSENLTIPVIINGEIWSPEMAQNAMHQSRCKDVMLGRGALARPDLARVIKQEGQAMVWFEVLALVAHYTEVLIVAAPKYGANRIKQWLSYLMLNYPEAELLFERIKREKDVHALLHLIKSQMDEIPTLIQSPLVQDISPRLR